MTKTCTKCGVPKALTEFHRKASSPDRLTKACKTCRRAETAAWVAANPGKHELNRSKWLRENPERRKEVARDYLKRRTLDRMGLSIAQYDAMLSAQGGTCAICKRQPEHPKRLCVDHCHRTGRVRGLLCHAHNLMIGNAQDRPEILTAGIEYLRKYAL